MNCTNCGAPLPPKSNICSFCDTLNDTNLRALGARRSKKTASDRACPSCDKQQLQSLRLGKRSPVEVDRCAECHGIFFDPGELEQIVDAAVKNPGWINADRLDALIKEETPTGEWKSFTYRRCPDCNEMMQRKVYGAKSGVITDRCARHGVWLDGGELHRILKWAAAGGQAHDRQAREKQAEGQSDRKKLDELLEQLRWTSRWGQTGLT